MILRLSYVLDALPKYENSFKNGPYKNGSYKSCIVLVPGFPGPVRYDLNDVPSELFESPWYIKSMTPTCLSAYGSKANVGLFIILDKEENNYV